MIELIFLGLAVSVISLLITKAGITTPLRNLVDMSVKDPVVHSYIYELVSCPFCMSFWVTVPLQLEYNFIPVASGRHLLDGFIGYLCIIGVAAIFSGIIHKLISEIE